MGDDEDDLTTLLLSQRAHPTFRATIKGSRKLQRKLFFRVPRSHGDEDVEDYVFNPWLDRILLSISVQPGNTHMCDLKKPGIDNFEPCEDTRGETPRIQPRVHIWHDGRILRNESDESVRVKIKKGCWRDMYVASPRCVVRVTHVHPKDGSLSPDFSYFVYEDLESKKLGGVVDEVKHMERTKNEGESYSQWWPDEDEIVRNGGRSYWP